MGEGNSVPHAEHRRGLVAIAFDHGDDVASPVGGDKYRPVIPELESLGRTVRVGGENEPFGDQLVEQAQPGLFGRLAAPSRRQHEEPEDQSQLEKAADLSAHGDSFCLGSPRPAPGGQAPKDRQIVVTHPIPSNLRSLGHEFDTATCQQDARELMDCHQHDYYLLDLEIPVETDRGLARIQNGENLLREIIARRGTRHAPVIVMTGHGTDGPKLAVQMMKLGAADYVTKPFDAESKTLDHAILEALAKNDQGNGFASGAGSAAMVPFKGGTLVFFDDRVELCGAMVVAGNTRIRQILELLRHRRPDGRFVAYSGAKLAKELKFPGGPNAVAEAVKDFRADVTDALENRGIGCGSRDVIQSGGRGYRLAEWITVEDGEGPTVSMPPSSALPRRSARCKLMQADAS
jgi:CheY-like chemotaxis protein